MTNKFDKILALLNSARGAEYALEWFEQFAKNALVLRGAITIQVHHGAVTPEGKAASHYVRKAFEEALPSIMAHAKSLAESDIVIGSAAIKTDE